jgi:hypothetical protein
LNPEQGWVSLNTGRHTDMKWPFEECMGQCNMNSQHFRSMILRATIPSPHKYSWPSVPKPDLYDIEVISWLRNLRMIISLLLRRNLRSSSLLPKYFILRGASSGLLNSASILLPIPSLPYLDPFVRVAFVT